MINDYSLTTNYYIDYRLTIISDYWRLLTIINDY